MYGQNVLSIQITNIQIMNTGLPKDPIMLLSVINMKLRDFYPTLEALCDDMDINQEELTEILKAIGAEYMPETNQFR